MDLISKLEKRFGSWAIPNLAVYIIAIQVIGVVMLMAQRADYNDLILFGNAVRDQGEWWRLLSFMMLPKTMSPIWLFFTFYIFYLIGNSLERQWGAFRFNLFILCGYLLTVAMAFVNPGAVITNVYFLGCVFLAFATLFPNVEFRIFFVLPVKVKWLGWITVGLYAMTLLAPASGPASAIVVGNKLGVVAAFINYLLFFGKDFVLSFKTGQRRKAFRAESAKTEGEVRHVCAKCGVTEKSDPSMHFRYCSTCGECFCEEHIGNHDHE
ncbi:hypothetical protein PDESU_02318 [Pontiella desulfatans]|uniref:Peptidase S54 rhomboid domain-containing protein n=1 Tax=Pontiella desulfatans TaxID=2750659 RepID=A0A6C2U2F4_PONDE|nr:hypothetical protein [Pontiella desulfatans]VGO13761.1 hypothetical protein PDESU_02318 [Pontiella desulfatans]